jgi:DNA polymerase-1
MIVGEAPGHREDDSGVPFVGRAGQLLRELLAENGFDDENVFITNAVCCRPPDNRTPTKKEITACGYWLNYQIEQVNPKFILLLGNVPYKAIFGGRGGIKKLRGKPVEHDGRIYVPTYHPAFILRDPSNQEALEADIRLLREIVNNDGIPQEEELHYTEVLDDDIFEKMLDDLTGSVAYDIETSCLYPWADTVKSRYYDKPVVTSLGFATRRNQWIIPMNHWEVHPFSYRKQRRMVREITKRLKDCILIAHNGKFDSLWMKVHYDVHWEIDFDTMLAHYLIDENSRHGLKFLSQVYFGAMDYDLPDKVDVSWAQLSKYHALDVLYTRKLKFIFSKKLYQEGDVGEVFYNMMMPMSEMYLRAEYNGVKVDLSKFDDAEAYLREQIAEAHEELSQWGNKDTNWRSVPQLSKILWGDLGLEPLDFTKKGAPSTNESVLKRLDHPIAGALLKLRGANQQLSFFIEGWKPFLVEDMLHPSYKLHGAVTGRPSCEHPNFQQVPRDPRIRSLITAPAGWELVEADLSQAELRIAAELANEQVMLETFLSGRDIHWQTAVREVARGGGLANLVTSTAKAWCGHEVDYAEAVQMLEKMGHRTAIELDGRWKEHRKKAKAINFGYLYGMWWKKFMIYARDNYGVIVTEDQARESRSTFFSTYPGLKPWHDRQKRYVRRNGYVTTLTGRKRRLPQAQLPYDCPERKEAQRQAINSPVQGFAAELTLMAGLHISDEFDWDTVKVVGTVHDSVHMWVRRNQVHRVVPRILEIMKRPALMDVFDIRLRVPIIAEATIGPWSQGKELEAWLESA